MNRPQRIVLILYCLLLVYCCVWIPWHSHVGSASWNAGSYIRLGYGWVWAGPLYVNRYADYAAPDLALIQLRLIAATAIGAAAFLSAGIRRKP